MKSPSIPEETGRVIFLLDNYDSFTENVADLFRQLGAELRVARNDRIRVEEVESMQPRAIVLSPGPGRPEDAGITIPLLRHFAGKIPILGICLGHQAIARAFGGAIVRGIRPVHGKTSSIHHEGEGVFQGLPSPFPATRYHSLVAQRESLSTELAVTAWTEENEIMGLRHRDLPVEGVQFHPESVLTGYGAAIFRNFLKRL